MYGSLLCLIFYIPSWNSIWSFARQVIVDGEDSNDSFTVGRYCQESVLFHLVELSWFAVVSSLDSYKQSDVCWSHHHWFWFETGTFLHYSTMEMQILDTQRSWTWKTSIHIQSSVATQAHLLDSTWQFDEHTMSFLVWSSQGLTLAVVFACSWWVPAYRVRCGASVHHAQ